MLHAAKRVTGHRMNGNFGLEVTEGNKKGT